MIPIVHVLSTRISLFLGPANCCLPRLRSPAHLLLPRWRPLPAALGEVLALSKLLLPEVAGNAGVAMPVDAVGEVLTGHADVGAFPALQVVLIDKIPFLHRSTPLKYACTSRDEVARSRACGMSSAVQALGAVEVGR